jgi:dual specificity protein phosphatase-like protein
MNNSTPLNLFSNDENIMFEEQEIIRGLFQGSVEAEKNAKNYDLIINADWPNNGALLGDIKTNGQKDFIKGSPRIVNIGINDVPEQDITFAIPLINAYIDYTLKQNKKVLVRCQMGVSRSTAIILAYLKFIKKWDLAGALQHIKNIRPIVNPNQGFLRQLQNFDPSITKNINKENNIQPSQQKICFGLFCME